MLVDLLVIDLNSTLTVTTANKQTTVPPTKSTIIPEVNPHLKQKTGFNERFETYEAIK